MNVLVTGATGFIGSHLCNRLNKQQNRVVVLVRDILPSPWSNWLSNALEGCTFVKGDILNPKLLRRIIAEYHIENVFHLAAQSLVSTALKDPTTTFEVNVMATVHLLEACRQLDMEKIYVMSTDKIYGNRMGSKENDPLISTGIYETSKSCQDLVAQAFLKTYGLHTVIGRSCNAYGYDLSPRIVPNTIRACMRGESPIIYEGEKTVRQYIYVEDLCEVIIHLMKHSPYRGAYNIATNDILTQEQVVKTICRFFPVSPRYIKREKPIHEIQSQSMICSNFEWKPRYSFEEGIKETIKPFERFGF